MNHAMSDETMSHLSSAAKLFVVNENAGGVPVMNDYRNAALTRFQEQAGAAPNKLDSNLSSMSSNAAGAKNGDQSLMQTSLGFLRRGGGRPLQKQRLARPCCW